MATGIIFAERSGRVRRIVTDSHADALEGHAGPGESYVLWFDQDIPAGMTPNADAATVFVAQHLGRDSIPSSRCCVLDDSLTVVAVMMADPLIDLHEGMLLVQDDEAQVGWRLQSDGTFVQPPVA